jgi:protein phosphatase 2C family protein 2/3
MIQSGIIYMLLDHQGDIAAKFAAKNLHKRVINDELYQERQYEPAMKRAFLGTDEDLRAG